MKSASLINPFLYSMRVLGSNLPKIINFFFFFFCLCLLLFFFSFFIECLELKIKVNTSAGVCTLIRLRNMHARSYMVFALMIFEPYKNDIHD